MARIDAELLRRCHYLSLVAQRAGGRSLVAETPRRRGGSVAEDDTLRDYVPGDDYRAIDWIRCARHDDLLSRTSSAPGNSYVYVLLDNSASMGPVDGAKSRLARRIVTALGYAAVTRLDCFGVSTFCDGLVDDLSPIRHRARLGRLTRFLDQLPLHSGPTDLRRAAEGFVRRRQPPGPVVVISDLYDRRGFAVALNLLRHHGYQPRVVQVYDPCDAEPEMLGEVELFDVESEAARQVTITERTARRYRELFARFLSSVRDYCAKYGVDCLQIASSESEDGVLLRALGGR